MTALPLEQAGIISSQDVVRRMRQLECQNRSCSCHAAAKTFRGKTHCPLHRGKPEATLEATADLEHTLRLECSEGCEQMRIWRAFFGPVLIAWEQARWEGVLNEPLIGQKPKPTRAPRTLVVP